MTDTITLATMADLAERLAEVGVSLNDVTTNPSPRIDVDRRADSGHLILVVTTYARDFEGHRYIDTETHEAAVEVRRFFITADWRLTSAPPINEGEQHG